MKLLNLSGSKILLNESFGCTSKNLLSHHIDLRKAKIFQFLAP